MNYSAVQSAYFLTRDNRFIASCRLKETNEIVTVHVINTGRSKELLLSNALVALEYCPSPKRKTSYDLIAVKKENDWHNIDSQALNQLVADGIKEKKILIPHLKGSIDYLKREVVFQHSTFDFYFETTQGEKGFIEVKGMTLENQKVGAFPDAPRVRGLKHVNELTFAQKEGFHCYVLFVAQFENLEIATIHIRKRIC